MSSQNTRNYLRKIVQGYSETTEKLRLKEQRKKVHILDTESLNTTIDRAFTLLNLDSSLADLFKSRFTEELGTLESKQGKLSFSDILEARQKTGKIGTVDTSKGKTSTSYFLTDANNEFVLDANGNKIALERIIQLGHQEAISTLQTRGKLSSLVNYRQYYIKNTIPKLKATIKDDSDTSRVDNIIKEDLALIDAFIGMFKKTVSHMKKIDKIDLVEEYFPDIFTNTAKGKTNRFIKKLITMKYTPIKPIVSLSITNEIKASLSKKVHKSGINTKVTFETFTDNNVKGALSSQTKQILLGAADLLLFKSQGIAGGKKLSNAAVTAKDPRKNPRPGVSLSDISDLVVGEQNWAGFTGSPSPVDYFSSLIVSKLVPSSKVAKINSNTTTEKTKTSITKKVSLASINLNRKIKPTSPKPIRLRSQTGAFQSVSNLEALIRMSLYETIKNNMHSPALNFQTGRFAESVELKSISYDNRAGAITTFLTYMKYPYATFEPGGDRGSIDRSPSSLITRSVREIATKLTKARMQAIIV